MRTPLMKIAGIDLKCMGCLILKTSKGCWLNTTREKQNAGSLSALIADAVAAALAGR
jgi:hypothetical protein